MDERYLYVSPLPHLVRPSDPTALELVIHRFEQEAATHHHKRALLAKAKADSKEAALQKQALDRDWEHLQFQRRKLAAHAQLQSDLDAYREDAKVSDAATLLEEHHHTNTKLARNLTAVAEPKPSPDHEAHHIVLGKGRWQKMRMMAARLTLHMHGIGINDPVNGVWLPGKKSDKGHWATPSAPAHREIHRYNYETWIANMFDSPTIKEMQVRNRLYDVKLRLTYGGYPPQILAPKDATWNGEE